MLLKLVVLVSGPPSSLNVAEATRPNRAFKEDKRHAQTEVGRPRVKEYKEAVLMNWMSPLVWSVIDRVSRGHSRMKPTEIVRELKLKDPILFAKLTTQTLGAWIDRSGDRPVWSEKTLERVGKGNKPGGLTTRVGVLVCRTNLLLSPLRLVKKIKYPEATAEVLGYIRSLREASITLTLNTVRGLMIAHLQHHVPQIFKEPSPDGTLFRCSEGFVLKFLHRALGWNMRRSTQAGRKIPENADEVLKRAFLRIAWVVKDEQIPSALIVNSDQTQVVLAQGCHMTYASSGATQVATVGAEEKRALTIFPSVTNDGKLLPIQAIHKGQSGKSLPSPTARSRYKSDQAGFLFEVSKTTTYWSTIATMQNFVNVTLAPYFDNVRKDLGLDQDHMALWLIDCWSVHRSKEFLDWMASKHPLIIVIFIPAGMTGLFQPCDVGLQRIFKHSLKISAHEDVVSKVLGQLQAGLPVQDIKVDTGIKILRDRTVHWIWSAYQSLNKVDIIKKVHFT